MTFVNANGGGYSGKGEDKDYFLPEPSCLILKFFISFIHIVFQIEIESCFYNWNICISSSMSNISILLVAAYQLITLSIDPFGVNGIITTPRCLATSLILWILTVGLGTSFVTLKDEHPGIFILVVAINFLVTLATGICYLVIFNAISKKSGALVRARRDENRQILRTLGLIYGTNLLAFALIAILQMYIEFSYLDDLTFCHRLPVVYSMEIVYLVDWFGNTLVYWWRLKDFRSFFRKCGLNQNSVEPFQTNFEFSSMANNQSMARVLYKQTK